MAQDLTTMSHEKGIKVLQFIWGAMVFSVGVYGVIVWIMPARAAENGIRDPLTIALGAVSAALFLVQMKIGQNLSDERLFPRILDLGSWGIRPEVVDRLKELQVPERGVQLILQAHIIFGVVIWSMAEAVALFGVFLFLSTGDTRLMAIFGAIALVMLIRFRPKLGAFKEQLIRWHRYVESNRERETAQN